LIDLVRLIALRNRLLLLGEVPTFYPTYGSYRTAKIDWKW